MSEHRRRIDEVLDSAFLTNLSEWPLDELRRRNAECLEREVSDQRRDLHQVIDRMEGDLAARRKVGQA
jgi:hypothetical protein